MNKLLTEIQNEIETKVKERGEQRKLYAKKLEQAKASLKAAREKKVAMISAEDKKGLRAANEEEADALAECEIFQTKLDAIPEHPLIEYADAERLLDRISSAFNSVESDTMKKAKTHIEALDKLETEYTQSADEAEKLVNQICFSLCDSDRYYVMFNGKRSAKKPMSVTGSRLFHVFMTELRNRYGYSVILGLDPRQNNQNPDTWGNTHDER